MRITEGIRANAAAITYEDAVVSSPVRRKDPKISRKITKDPRNQMACLAFDTGRLPIIFPVCPFMAKRKFCPSHCVLSSQTGNTAYSTFSLTAFSSWVLAVTLVYPCTVACSSSAALCLARSSARLPHSFLPTSYLLAR